MRLTFQLMDQFKNSFVHPQNDYQKHEMTEKRKAIIPAENTMSSKEPLDATTMYQQYYTHKELPSK